MQTLRQDGFNTHCPSQRRGEDRRLDKRTYTVFRVARVTTARDRGLARVMNISDGGVMLGLSFHVDPGDSIAVDLSDRIILLGRVQWVRDGRCGVYLVEPIDSIATLKKLYEEQTAADARGLRIDVATRVSVETEDGLILAAVTNLSQKGMGLRHEGQLAAGCTITVRLTDEIQCRGTVRWSHGNKAGVQLSSPLSIKALGSCRALRHAS